MDSLAAASLTVGGLTLAVRASDARLRFTNGPGSDAFYAGGAAPDVLLHARFEDLDRWKPGETVFDTHGSWRLTREGEVLSFACLASHLGAVPYKVARLRPGDAEGELLIHRGARDTEAAVEPLQFPLAELLFIDLLSRRGGVLVHACGVVVNGRGLLFTGHSQAGKTTTARLWENVSGAVVLSDDRIVLRLEEDGRYWMFGTPWHGDAALSVAERAPLAAVFVLEHGDRNAFVDLSKVEAVSSLLARSFLPFHDPSAMDSTLALLEELVDAVPCRRYPFVPGPEAVRCVLEKA